MSDIDPTIQNINPPTQVVPESTSDGFHHELDDDCPCGPRAEPVKRDDGSVGWLLIHHGLDGREKTESSHE